MGPRSPWNIDIFCLFVCLIVCLIVYLSSKIQLPAVEGDVPVLVDGEEHGGGGEGGQAGKLTLAHLEKKHI